MQINQMLLTPSKYTRQQTPIKVTKIAVHYVGNPNSTALGNRNYFESLSKSHATKASSHYIIGLHSVYLRMNKVLQLIKLIHIQLVLNVVIQIDFLNIIIIC